MSRSKKLIGSLFVFLLAFLGMVAGTGIGALFVPAGSGLAGPAIALGYGVAGLATATMVGIVLAVKLTYPQLRTALIFAGLPVFIAAAFLLYRYATVRYVHRNKLGAVPKMILPAGEVY